MQFRDRVHELFLSVFVGLSGAIFARLLFAGRQPSRNGHENRVELSG